MELASLPRNAWHNSFSSGFYATMFSLFQAILLCPNHNEALIHQKFFQQYSEWMSLVRDLPSAFYFG
jgi:hypothetical protein